MNDTFRSFFFFFPEKADKMACAGEVTDGHRVREYIRQARWGRLPFVWIGETMEMGNSGRVHGFLL